MEQQKIIVELSGFYHKGTHRLGIHFDNYGSINGPLYKAGALWSRTHKCWHVPLRKEAFEKVMAILTPVASVNRSKLDTYLTQLKQPTATATVPTPAAVPAIKKPIPAGKIPAAKTTYLNEANAAALQQTQQALILKGYSQSTQRTYLNELRVFFTQLGKHEAHTFTTQRLKDYLSYCHTQLQLSENTIHSRMNALKFYYEQLLGKEKLFWEIPRPKKHVQLPKVISEEKIIQGLMQISNLKHKTLLLMAYSCGLRVSEATRIRLTDLNWDRMQLLVHKSKGKKDRIVPLANALQPLIQQYIAQYHPTNWLFENGDKSSHYSTKSAQVIFRNAYAMFDLPKSVTFHSLRHSYATHLLESGIDISYIQQLLGHNDIKTTLRYTHVSKKELGKIENPLDKLLRKHNN